MSAPITNDRIVVEGAAKCGSEWTLSKAIKKDMRFANLTGESTQQA